MAAKIVGRGVVLIWAQGTKVSAVVSKTDAEAMRRRWGGRIVDVKGQPYRIAAASGLRVLTNPASVLSPEGGTP